MKTPARMGKLIGKVRSSVMAKNTIYYSINFAFQIVVQLGYFLLISRSLGPAGYGVFASVTAVALFAGVFVGWGSERLLVQNVTLDRASFPKQLGHTLILNAVTVFPILALTILVLSFMDTRGLSWEGLLLILLADIVFRKTTSIASSSFMGFDRAGTQTVIDLGSQVLRLAAAGIAFLVINDLTLDVWAIFYASGAGVAAVIGMLRVLRELGRPKMHVERGTLWLGFLYSLEFASLNGVKDLDKPVVVQVLGPEIGGIYTAAFRIVDAASAPIRALLYATYTRYFREAGQSRKAGIDFGVRIIPFVFGASAVVGLGLFACAGFLPLLIGAEFQGVVPLIRWLAVYPLLLGLMGVGADILRAIGRQGLRVLIMSASTLAIVPFCWIGATTGGEAGAIAARLLVQLFLVLASWGAVRYFRNR